MKKLINHLIHLVKQVVVASSQKTKWNYSLLAFFWIFFTAIKICTLTPEIELGGDAVGKWRFTKDFQFGVEHETTHHTMRWSCNIPAYLISHTISRAPLGYYLTALLLSTPAFLIFALTIFRLGGLIPSVLFLAITAFEAQMLRGSFQLLPTYAALLPLSLMFYFIAKPNFIRKSYKNILILALLTFWLYGAKITNLFFIPGLIWILWQRLGWRYILFYGLILLAGYGLETGFFLGKGENFPVMGRIYELLNGNHAQGMYDGIYVSDATFSTLFERWTMTDNYYIYLVALLGMAVFLLAPLGSRWLQNKFHLKMIGGWSLASVKSMPVGLKAICWMHLSFTFITTFFIVSVDPLILGQPLAPRYLAVIVPGCVATVLLVAGFFIRRILWTRMPQIKERLLIATFIITLKIAIVLWIGFIFYHKPIIKRNIKKMIVNPTSLTERLAYYRNLKVQLKEGSIQIDDLTSEYDKSLTYVQKALIPYHILDIKEYKDLKKETPKAE